MKKYIITGLLAFVVILGMNARTLTNSTNPVVIGGPNTYPHMTGACYCGQYPSCHPRPLPSDEDSDGYIRVPPRKN